MDNEAMELPPGFRFHPTDEELITHYLSQKVLNNRFCARAIGEVDLNRVEPWDLPWKAKMGEKEWYFFCVRDRKYPTGMRTNRATDAGYWKATGKDREIYRMKELVGMKKTLVFYRGRAPRGGKTNWVMHEYRLEGRQVMYSHPRDVKNEWIICRVFQKSLGGKKMHISALLKMRSVGDELEPPTCPSLGESSAHNGQTKSTAGNASDLTCFSNPSENQKPQEDMVESLNTPFLASSSPPSINPSDISSVPNPYFSTQVVPTIENFHYPSDPFLMHDQSMLRLLLNNNGPTGPKRNWKTELPIDSGINNVNSSSAVSNQEMMGHRPYFDQDELITAGGQVDLGCLWNY